MNAVANPYVVGTVPLRQQFQQFTSLLHHTLSADNAPFERHDGRIETLKISGGAAYYTRVVSERVRGQTPWIANTAWARAVAMADRRAGKELPLIAEWPVLYLIFWPRFLWQARYTIGGETPDQPSLRPLAHSLLYLLRDLVKEYDFTLYEMIERFQANFISRLPESKESMPSFFGEEDDRDRAKFNAHLFALLRNTSCMNYVKETMDGVYDLVLNRGDMTKLPLCPRTIHTEQPHRRGQDCDACRPLKWLRRVSLLHPERMTAHFFWSRYKFEVKLPQIRAQMTSPWALETQRILSLLDSTEGVVYTAPPHGRGEYILINFKRIVEEAANYRPDSPMAQFMKGANDSFFAGYKAKRAFEEFHKVTYGQRFKTLKELVEEAGWEWRETLEIPYEMYVKSSLLKKEEGVKHLLKRTVKVSSQRKHELSTSPVRARIAMKEFDSEKIGRVPIFFFQRKFKGQRLTYYTLPYNLSEVELAPARRRGASVTREEKIFWSLHGVNRHAQLKTDSGEYVYPLAAEYALWLAKLDQSIGGDRKVFLKHWHEATYARRQTELAHNERAHLGRFTEGEDAGLRRFMLAREKTRHFTSEEWMELRALLPGRTDVSIRRRVEMMGKEYARQHGWIEFCKSPWCLQINSTRRHAWLKEGIPLEQRKQV